MARSRRSQGSRVVWMYVLSLGVLVAAGVAASIYPVELELSRSDPRSTRIVVALAEVDEALESGAGYVEYSTVLRAALAAHRSIPVRGVADTRLDHAVGDALECYKALRECWQLEQEGAWDPALHGSTSYWHTLHPALDLPEGDLPGPATLRAASRSQAREYLGEALWIAGR